MSVGTYLKGKRCPLLKEPLATFGGTIAFYGTLVEKPRSRTCISNLDKTLGKLWQARGTSEFNIMVTIATYHVKSQGKGP